MPAFRDVDFWPPTGFVDRPWDESPDVDAFARTARRVASLVSEVVAEQRLTAPMREIRLALNAGDGPELRGWVGDPDDGMVFGQLWVPTGVATLGPTARALLALDVLVGALERVCARDGLPADLGTMARSRALAAGLVYDSASPWKSDLRRRYEVRACHRIGAAPDDGFARTFLEIRDRATQDVVARSAPVLDFCTREGLVRGARTLRWRRGSAQVATMIDAFGGTSSGLVLHPSDGIQSPPLDTVKPIQDDMVRPLVTLGDQPVPSPISFFNAPTPQVPHAYTEAMFWLWQGLAEDHLDWWSKSGFDTLEVHHVATADLSPRTIPRSATLRVTIGRSVEALRAAEDIAALAQQDAQAAVDAVAARVDLPAPELPPLPRELVSAAAKSDARDRRLEQEALDLLSEIDDRLTLSERRTIALNLREGLPIGALMTVWTPEGERPHSGRKLTEEQRERIRQIVEASLGRG